MTFRTTRGAPLRAWLALIVLVAVMARGLVPAGWMPNITGDGSAPLIICQAGGLEHHHQSPSNRPDAHHDTCVFAGLSAALGPSLAALAGPAESLGAPLVSLAPDSAPLARRLHRQQAARAPPALI